MKDVSVSSLEKKSLIVDAFLFYNEIDLLKARLEYLGHSVDHFIISEANIDFSGKPKRFLLDSSTLAELPFANKVIYHREKISLYSPTWIFKKIRYLNRVSKFLWKIQDAQRNALLKSISHLKNDAIVLFGDLDEIPNIAVVESIQHESLSTPKVLQQRLFYYDCSHFSNNEPWNGTIVCSLSDFRKIKPYKLRSQRNAFPYIASGGWHLSYFMAPSLIQRKINSIADVEKITQFMELTTDEIVTRIKNNDDLFDREICFTSPSVTDQIPADLQKIIKKYLPNCA